MTASLRHTRACRTERSQPDRTGAGPHRPDYLPVAVEIDYAALTPRDPRLAETWARPIHHPRGTSARAPGWCPSTAGLGFTVRTMRTAVPVRGPQLVFE